MDFTGFSKNVKFANSTSSISLTNGVNTNLSGVGARVTFTVSSTSYAFVWVRIGTVSQSDFENKPMVYVNGSVAAQSQMSASIGNGSNRVYERSFAVPVTLAAGENTISAGVAVASATSPSIPSGNATITAIVLGNVTA